MAAIFVPPANINAFNFGATMRAIFDLCTAISAQLDALGVQMAEDFTAFNAAVTALQTEVAAIATQMDTLFADLTTALGSGNQPAVDAATAAMQAQITALQAAATRDMPPAPPPPPGP
jgi:hypothetical protein